MDDSQPFFESIWHFFLHITTFVGARKMRTDGTVRHWIDGKPLPGTGVGDVSAVEIGSAEVVHLSSPLFKDGAPLSRKNRTNRDRYT